MEESAVPEGFEDLFKSEIDEYTLCKLGVHRINTTSKNPICQRNGRIPVAHEEIVEQEIEKNLKLGIIRPSESSWCSRIVMVPKGEGKWRMCIDYRALNQITIRDRYSSPRIDEIYDAMANARVFSILDATSGYYQLALAEEDKEKSAFEYKGKLYEFNRLPFGLCNAPATFQRTMDLIFGGENRKFVIPYLDDIIIFSEDEASHKKHLDIVMGKIRAVGLALNKNKCKFFKSEVKILGNIVGGGCIRVDNERVEFIKNYPEPTTIKQLRSFLGVVNFCREFIKNFASFRIHCIKS